MKSDNEEVAASLCLKYGLRLGDGQRVKVGTHNIPKRSMGLNKKRDIIPKFFETTFPEQVN
jgi:hypothetical protein